MIDGAKLAPDYRAAFDQAFPRDGHACCICTDADDEAAAAAGCLEWGLRQGLRCVYIASEETRRRVLANLLTGASSWDRLSRIGSFVLTDAMPVGSAANLEHYVDLISEAERTARDEGYEGLCIVCEAGRLFPADARPHDLMEKRLVQLFRAHGTCSLNTYNRQHYASSSLPRVLRLYPHILTSRGLFDNPHFDEARFGQAARGDSETDRLLALAQDRHELEQALVHAERFRDTLYDASPVPTEVVDSGGRIGDCNAAWEALLGYSRGEVSGCRFDAFVTESTRTRQDWDQLFSAGVNETRQPIQAYLVRKDGDVLDVMLHFAAVEGPSQARLNVVFAADQTGQRRLEAGQVRIARRLHAILSTLGEGFIEIDAAGVITDANPAAAQMLGCAQSDVIGLSLQAVLRHPAASFRPGAALRTVSKGGGGEGAVEQAASGELRRRDGELLAVDFVIRPLLEQGEVTGAIVLLSDTQDRQHLEAQLRQSQKMDAIGRLAGGVAHDFNNLLTAILGTTELLAAAVQDEGHRASLLEIKKAADRAAALTQRLLAFSRRQVLQARPLDLNAVVADLRTMLDRLMPEHVEMRVTRDENLGLTKADPNQIEQVLMNLAINARDAMPGGGVLEFRTGNQSVSADEALKRPGLKPGQYVFVEARDTGEGISPEVISHIFEPFFTTKPEGTGLGLSMVYGIVKQSDGFIDVESTPGEGTVFRVLLPRIEPPKTAEPYIPPVHMPSEGSETVLVVEDEDVVRKLVEKILSASGYRVLVAASGEEAVALAEAYKEPIDMVLTDVVMPGMGGREVAEALQAMRPGVRVMYMSGHTEDAFLHQGLIDPDIPFLRKPFRPSELTARIRELLDEA